MLTIHSIKPLHTKLLVTAERYNEDASSNGLIMKTSGSIKEYQKVIATGPLVRDINAGDLVMINPSRYMKRQYSDNSLREEFVENPVISVNIPVVEIDEVPYFLIDCADVEYVITDYDEEDSPKSSIIQPRTPQITV